MAVALARLRVIARHLHVPAASSSAGGAAAARLHSAASRLSASAAARRAASNGAAAAAVRVGAVGSARAMGTAATGAGAGAGRITDYSRFISELSQRRKPSAIRSLTALVGKPGMISLGGGLPNPDMFPFDSLSFSLKSGEKLQLTPKELAEGLQYSATPGLPALVQWLKELQQRTHKPPYAAASGGAASPDWSVAITVGSQDAICKAFEALLNPGDALLVDSPTYSGTLAFLKPLNCTLIGVETDAFGIVPASLEKCILSAKTKPKVLYTIPTGQNPSGSTFSLERRHAVYALAAKHDLIIMEDDPYYFLYYGDKPAPPKGRDGEFKRPQLQSLMSMDTQGRVLRFDSLSKALSAGMRLGFVTGPTALVERINLHSQATNLHASTIAQALTLKLLTHWGPAGWDKQIDAVSLFYARKRDAFTALAKKHLTGLAEWTTPTAGMFVWFKLLNGISDSQALISQKALEKKVLLVPGQAFMPNNEKSCYVRASFSTASEADMDVALGRLAEVIREAKS